MKGHMTALADKKQARLRTVVLTGIATTRARLTGIVSIHLDAHSASQDRFIGNRAMQFSKGPLTLPHVGTALLLGGFLALLAAGTLADPFQVLKADDAVRMLLH